MDGSIRLRVYNKTKYDIGVTLQSGQQPNIMAGSFIMLTADEICQIDGNARGRKPFSSGELVAVDGNGKELSLEELGGYTDARSTKHFEDAEIEANLKKSGNQIKKWLEDITDPVEIHSILKVAEGMDLQQSKIALIKSKISGNEIE